MMNDFVWGHGVEKCWSLLRGSLLRLSHRYVAPASTY